MISGIIFIDKPAGITSFQALGRLKKALGHKKLGHTGTLDKFASGLIVVLAGAYTRLNPYFTNLDKTYLAEFTFGKETATLDPEGDVIHEAPVPDRAAAEAAVSSFVGEQMQIPPDFSAVHVNGKRAYQRKLAGETVEIPARKIFIESIDILGWEENRLRLRISCSKGTYIRSLARDLGVAAGSRAYVSALKRERVGICRLERSVTPEGFVPERDLISGPEAFTFLPDVRILNITSEGRDRIKNGVPFERRFCKKNDFESGTVFAMVREDDFLGILEYRDGKFSYGFIAGGN